MIEFIFMLTHHDRTVQHRLPGGPDFAAQVRRARHRGVTHAAEGIVTLRRTRRVHL